MKKFSLIEQHLIRDEGLELKPYKCPAGYLTIGVGRNLESKGLTEEEVFYLLNNDIQESILDLIEIFGEINYYLFGDRSLALINMRFNLGPNGFRKFKKMIQAVKLGDYNLAADEMINSKWYSQVGDRAKRIVNIMRAGI